MKVIFEDKPLKILLGLCLISGSFLLTRMLIKQYAHAAQPSQKINDSNHALGGKVRSPALEIRKSKRDRYE